MFMEAEVVSIPFMRPYFSESGRKNIHAGIEEIFQSGRLMMGPYAEKLEQSFRDQVSLPHAISVTTCTTALQICLQYFDVAGGEVLVPSGSFVTDVSAVQWSGADAVLVDMNSQTLSFDMEDLERKVSSRTKAIIWVHLAGIMSSEHGQIVSFARERGIPLIEDCAHALGASVDGVQAGALGDAACYSFYPTKIITSGTGGMIATRDSALDRYAREIRLFGRDAETGKVGRLGNDWFLDEIRACVAYFQMCELDEFLAHRRASAGHYDEILRNHPGLRLLDVPNGNLPSYYQYSVFLDAAINREELIKNLKDRHGVVAKEIYLPTHKETVFQHLDDGALKQTEETLARSLCLPMFVGLSDQEVEEVAHALTTEIRQLL